MQAQNKRLSILSEEERFALYALPDFNEMQQDKYLITTYLIAENFLNPFEFKKIKTKI